MIYGIPIWALKEEDLARMCIVSITNQIQFFVDDTYTNHQLLW